MIYEVQITVPRTLREVALADPAAPLPPVVFSSRPLTAAEEQARREAEQLKQAQIERDAIHRVLAGMTQAAQNLQASERQLLAEMQRLSVELAVAIASRLIHDKLSSGDFAVETLVRETVERVGSKRPVKVFLHPHDVALLEQRLQNSGQPFSDRNDVQVVVDPLLRRGDCRAETADVRVIAQLEAQLTGLRQNLLEALTDAQA